MRTTYREFFENITGYAPFRYQERLAKDPWPEVIDIPTGLGKTAAVVGAWLYRVASGDRETGRRLVYCLPMRVLVEQTVDVAKRLCDGATATFRERGFEGPTVHPLLGGFVDEVWEEQPERPAILVGTQDMLVSRALARGYAMSRYKWPIHFGLLHSDCLWVLDETQLMGVAVETTAQLEGLRRRLGTLGPSHTIWMSATLGRAQLETVDHPRPQNGYRVLSLDEHDRGSKVVVRRTGARKQLERSDLVPTIKGIDAYAAELATTVARIHADRGGLTLIVMNRVDRAQAAYRALGALGVSPLALVHSRFRGPDRKRQEALLHAEGSRVVVATQAIEAGLDISARTLLTELAPWPSLVQRFGRCNRYGDEKDACICWIDLDVENDGELALPYEAEEVSEARDLLRGLRDASPELLSGVAYSPPPLVRPVLRKRDLLDLFDTSSDLLGNDVDVSRFVRDGTDTDVKVYFRLFDGEPDSNAPAPAREELVSVSLGAAKTFLERLKKKRESLGEGERDRERKRWLRAWVWEPLAKNSGSAGPTEGQNAWTAATAVYPGQVLLLHGGAGGYDGDVGWTGEVLPKHAVEPYTPEARAPSFREMMASDPRTEIGRWVTIQEHLADVEREAATVTAALDLPERFRRAVTIAGLWHDLGKIHLEFQRRLVEPVKDDPEKRAPHVGPWAKSNHHRRPPPNARPYFRHELASAIAWLQHESDDVDVDLIAYLIAAHHGKVRLTLRSVPSEQRPSERERLFALGVWDGDELPAVHMPDGSVVGPIVLNLSPMRLGEGSWLERSLSLRDAPEIGPFRLAFLESLVRIADWRASEKERTSHA